MQAGSSAQAPDVGRQRDNKRRTSFLPALIVRYSSGLQDDMSRHEEWVGKATPAQLSFLAIYNPSIGTDKETLAGQIVFWYSNSDKQNVSQKKRDKFSEVSASIGENERERQVGLAQGMVNFARTFSNGEPVESIETDKQRIVLTELESDWWILAAIDFACVPITRTNAHEESDSVPLSSVEYSSREVSPPQLLLQQLRRANSIFLLHQSPSLQYVWARQSRQKFSEILGIFWTKFAQTWEIILQGNPAVDVFNGIKLAAGGELGVGVGEENWGSGEREVLEGLIENTEGLKDMIVSRFGDAAPEQPGESSVRSTRAKPADTTVNPPPWTGNGRPPDPADGVVFSGVGKISRQSLRDISGWIEWIYANGEDAYAVKHHARSGRAKRLRKERRTVRAQILEPQVLDPIPDANSDPDRELSQDIPVDSPYSGQQTSSPPIVHSSSSSDVARGTFTSSTNEQAKATYHLADSFPKDQMMKYLTLGYGTVWTGFGKKIVPSSSDYIPDATNQEETVIARDREADPKSEALQGEGLSNTEVETANYTHPALPSSGRFIIGLRGDLDLVSEAPPKSNHTSPADEADWIMTPDVRTVYVRYAAEDIEDERGNGSSFGSRRASTQSRLSDRSQSQKSFKRLKIIVYAHRPFIFTLLFESDTFSLTMPSFYRNLHLHLRPLHKSLLLSTDPVNVAMRLHYALNSYHLPERRITKASASSIFDIIFDPNSLLIHSSIPNVPIPGTLAAEGIGGTSWTRTEALSVHSQILNTYADTRRSQLDYERTGKTRQGWWIVWMRLPPNSDDERVTAEQKEAILIRRASEYTTPKPSGTMARLAGRDGTSSVPNSGGSWAPSKLAEGIGVDARRYVESLLSLAR